MYNVIVYNNKPIRCSTGEISTEIEGEILVTTSQDVISSITDWTYDPVNKNFFKGNDYKFKSIRIKRDQLLKDSDYTQLSDSTYPSTQDAWKTYRQQLRDITKGVTDPDTIVFPEEPK
tara:strand:+ start:1739 stop:2092 length:354 start_codon:yes stop_codon:yes gene_type:complete